MPKPDLKQAMETAAWFHKLFGDRYFIEIQNNGLEIQQMAMEGAVEVAKRMGLPLVATSDAHYVNREDAEAQDVLLCINTGKFRTDTNRMRMEGSEFYLRGPDEMYQAFPGFEDAVARSQQIADSVDIQLELGKRHFPNFTPPDNKTPAEYLKELCIEGLKGRYADEPEMYADGELAQVVIDRLDRELGVINKLGFPNYFLIVWDFVRFATAQNIPATARGSGVGSLVAFALGMSHVCPLKYDLLFERFLDDQPPGSARYRYRLLQGSPRRGDPVRQGQVRRRERGPDRHVRHAGRPGGHSRRRPRARSAAGPRRRHRGHGARLSSASSWPRRSNRAKS